MKNEHILVYENSFNLSTKFNQNYNYQQIHVVYLSRVA